jgi:putative ABC transport system permease protein
MSSLKQMIAVTGMNLRNVPNRLGTSSVVVIGIAGVVGVLVSVFGMTDSISRTLAATGHSDRAIVLRGGATSEIASTLDVDAVQTISDAPGIRRTEDGNAAATADVIGAVNLFRREDGTRAGLTVRGMSPRGFAVRPELELVEGRLYRPGLREFIVGRSAQVEFGDLDIGDQVRLRDGPWTVVGAFRSGDAFESSVISDAATLLSTFQRTVSNSVTVQLESESAFDTFRDALTTNPTLSVSVERETQYYERQSQNVGGILTIVTRFVGGIMALGAVFAALNTMYSAVSSRVTEIATLRAIGFGAGSVVVSVLAEALLLAVIGALIGAGVAWALFGGNTISMGGGISSLVFELSVTPALVGVGIIWACAVGFLGGLFPAIRAARLPVATALRAV